MELTHSQKLRLRDLMHKHFNREELKALCFSIQVSFEDLPAGMMINQIGDLIEYCQRHGKMSQLIQACVKERPDLPWPSRSATQPMGETAVSPTAQNDLPNNRVLPFSQKTQLIEALLACPSISQAERRDVVISNLPSEIRDNISRTRDSKTDVTNLLNACLNYEQGLQQLIEIVTYYENDSIPGKRFKALGEQFV